MLPQGTIDAPMQDSKKLVTVLQFHTISGKLMSSDLRSKDRVKTVSGEGLTIDASEGLRVGNVLIFQPDIEASNGTIHGVDRVLIPQSIRVKA